MTDLTPQNPSATATYRKLGKRRRLVLIILGLLVVASLLLDVLTGPALLSLSNVISTILFPESADPTHRTIVWSFRLPTALMALLVGAALAIAGAEMQTILNNPLASPYTLGVSAAASCGAALALVFGQSVVVWSTNILIPLSAFICAMLCSLSIYGLGRMKGGTSETVILGGVALHFIFSSGVAFLQFIASDDALQAIVFWMFGSLQGATWDKLAILGVVLVLTVIPLTASTWQLTALRLGESHARSLGVDVRRLRLKTLVLISVLTATAVCFTGAIGFIGLVAPHLARMTVGEDQRFFLPSSALYGALLVSAAAVLCKTLVPGTIFPIGVLTAAIGAPFFFGIALLKRRTNW